MTTIHRILFLALAAGSAAPAHAVVERSFSCAQFGGDCPKAVADAHGDTAGVTTTSVTIDADACDGETTAVGGVSVDLVHGHVGDLTLELVPPGGAPVQLIGRLADAAGIVGGCSSDDLVTRLDASGETAVCSGGTIPATQPRVRASGDLGGLGQLATAGTWELRISDAVPGGYGVLTGWRLHLDCNLEARLFADGFE